MTRAQSRTASRAIAPRLRGRDDRQGPRRGGSPDLGGLSGLSTHLDIAQSEVGGLFDASPAPMVLLSGTGVIESANAAMERLLGRPAGELRGMLLTEVLPAPPGLGPRVIVRDVLSSRKRTMSFDCEARDADGGVVCARVTVSSLRPGGGSRAALATVENLTAQRAAERRADAAEAQLRHASRLALAGELSGSLAHEMGQPLAAVTNYTQAALVLLSKNGRCTKEALGYVRAASEEAQRGARIVRNLAMFVRSRRSERAAADLGEVVGEIGAMIRAAAGNASSSGGAGCGGSVGVAGGRQGVAVGIEIEGRLPVMADRVQIQQVVLNLAKNAAEATMEAAARAAASVACLDGAHGALPPGALDGAGPMLRRRGERGGALAGAEAAAAGPGPVVVRVWSPEPGVAEVMVRDAGPGLPPGVAERVFSPFFTTKEGGMGLGLTICRSIIEAHGGRLWGENNAPPGSGATFRFRLPLSPNNGDQSYDG